MDNENAFVDFSVPELPGEPTLSDIKADIRKHTTELCVSVQEKLITIHNQPHRVCDIDDKLWLETEKKKMLTILNRDVSDVDSNLPETSVEQYIELYEFLVKENAEEERMLKNCTQQLLDEENQLNEIKSYLKLLEGSLVLVNSKENNDSEVLDLEEIDKNSMALFLETKENFHYVLSTCYGEGMKILLRKLVEAYFQGGDDKYIDISDITHEDYHFVELLIKAKLVVYHPYNKRKLKLDDFK